MDLLQREINMATAWWVDTGIHIKMAADVRAEYGSQSNSDVPWSNFWERPKIRDNIPLDLSHVGTAIIAFGVAIIISIFELVIEIVYVKLRKRRKVQRRQKIRQRKLLRPRPRPTLRLKPDYGLSSDFCQFFVKFYIFFTFLKSRDLHCDRVPKALAWIKKNWWYILTRLPFTELDFILRKAPIRRTKAGPGRTV